MSELPAQGSAQEPAQPNTTLLDEFRQHLLSQNFNPGSAGNYVSDIKHFLGWLETNGLNVGQIDPTDLQSYRSHLQESLQAPLATVNRRLTALRRFGDFAVSSGVWSVNHATATPDVAISATPSSTQPLTQSKNGRSLWAYATVALLILIISLGFLLASGPGVGARLTRTLGELTSRPLANLLANLGLIESRENPILDVNDIFRYTKDGKVSPNLILSFQGNPPFEVTSSSLVANLNSNYLEGHPSSYFLPASTDTNLLHNDGLVTLNGALTINNGFYVPLRLENFGGKNDFLVAQSNGTPVLALQAGGNIWTAGMIEVNGVWARGPSQLTQLTVTGTTNLLGLLTAADINATTLTTSGNVSVGGNLTVSGSTTLNGGVSSTGNITPAIDNTYDLGTTSLRWRKLELGPGSLEITSTTGTSGAGTNYTLGKLEFSSANLRLSTSSVGSGSIGTLQFTTGTNVGLNIDGGGNVGIGTTAPNNLLTLAGTGSTNQIRLSKTDSTTNDWNIGYVSGSTALVIQPTTNANFSVKNSAASQLFNIDTTSPSAISGGSQIAFIQDTNAFAADVGGNLTFRGIYTSGGSTAAFAGLKAGKTNATDGNLDTYLAFYARSNASGFLERMRLDASGNVLPGTNASQDIGSSSLKWRDLWLSGTVNAGSGVSSTGNINPTVDNTYDLGTTSLRWRKLNVGPGSVDLTSTTGTSGAGANYTLGSLSFSVNNLKLTTSAVGTGATGTIQLTTGANTGLNIDSSGNVGVGTAGPTALLQVAGTINVTGFTSANCNCQLLINGNQSITAETSQLLTNGNTFTTSNSLTNERFNWYDQTTIAGSAATKTITSAYSQYIGGAPIAGTNAAITTSYGLRVAAGSSVGTGTTTAYGLYVDAPTGAGTNYGAVFPSGNIGIGTSTPTLGKLQVDNQGAGSQAALYLTSTTNTGLTLNTDGGAGAVGAFQTYKRSGTTKFLSGLGPISGNDVYEIGNATTLFWQVNSSGHLLAGADNTYNIGASGANRPAIIRAANLFVGGGTELADLTGVVPGTFYAGNGQMNRPAYSFNSGVQSGFWRDNTASAINLSAGGTTRLSVTESGSTTITAPNGQQINLAGAGTVTIATLAAASATTVCRDGSNQFSTCSSSRTFKDNITYLSDNQLSDILGQITDSKIATFTFKTDRPTETRFGIIAEEAPVPLRYIDEHGNPNLDFYSAELGYTWAGIKALNQKVNTLAKASSLTDPTFNSVTATTVNLANLNFGQLKLTVDPSGALKIDGNLVVAGSGTFASLHVLGDLALDGSLVAQNGLTVKLGGGRSFQVQEASGSAQLAVDQTGVKVRVLSIATDSATPTNNTTGTATITANTKLVTVNSSKVTPDSKVVVTFKGDFSPATHYWIDQLIEGASFTINLDQPAAKDVSLTWWIVN